MNTALQLPMAAAADFVSAPSAELNRSDLLLGTFLLYMPIGPMGTPVSFLEAVRYEAFAVAAISDNGMGRLSKGLTPYSYPDNVWFTHGLVMKNGNFYPAPQVLGSLGGILTILNQHQVSRMSLLDINR